MEGSVQFSLTTCFFPAPNSDSYIVCCCVCVLLCTDAQFLGYIYQQRAVSCWNYFLSSILPHACGWQVMECALLAKFSTHNKLRRLLVATRPRPLMASIVDAFWGCGGPCRSDGGRNVCARSDYQAGIQPTAGQNRLGVLLMRVRDKLRDTKKCADEGTSRSGFLPPPSVGIFR